MAHDHDHHHGESYFLDQICTVLGCGLVGGLAFLVWKSGLLQGYSILKEQFHAPVLYGGVALMVAVVIRGVALWAEAGKAKAHVHDHGHGHHHHDHDHNHAHDHDHDHHGHAHDHDHAHDHHTHKPGCGHEHHDGEVCDHDHDHGHAHGHIVATMAHTHVHDHADHDHGFAPWRYAVLLMPLMLSGLLVYYHYKGMELGYSTERLLRGNEATFVDSGDGTGAVSREMNLGFQELTLAAPNPARHAAFDGAVGSLRGLYKPITDKQFSLIRWKMTCCGADAVPLKVRIITPEPLKIEAGKGVEVKGKIEFRRLESGEYIPIMRMRSADDIRVVDLGRELYEP